MFCLQGLCTPTGPSVLQVLLYVASFLLSRVVMRLRLCLFALLRSRCEPCTLTAGLPWVGVILCSQPSLVLSYFGVSVFYLLRLRVRECL